ncbi:hypothetical protein AWB67_04680 [Caballeronia terrestris]|jgi:hypothetical protein|uniref:Uncharacterized protein n=1 Tax=Caballeronia terrestris TaxID=1226301 RepID=A0A158K364_9BURK|nr:hypothetical protein AWB67_04680 [Caballeronia terrestris]
MTRYLQEELTTFWGRLTPYLALLESAKGSATGPIGRVTIDTPDQQAFALHTTDTKPSDDTSQAPTGQSATYTRLRVDGSDWGPWQREAYE